MTKEELGAHELRACGPWYCTGDPEIDRQRRIKREGWMVGSGLKSLADVPIEHRDGVADFLENIGVRMPGRTMTAGGGQ